MARLFVGTFLHQAGRELIAALPEQNSELPELINREIRWVRPEKLHMTWFYLGPTAEETMELIAQVLGRAIERYLAAATGIRRLLP